jgi:hypothetical protein
VSGDVITAGVELERALPDRRRSHRAAVGPGSCLTMSSARTVQLLDLSLAGLAFSSPYGLEAGRTVSMRATLGGEAFTVRIRTCWSAASGGAAPGGRRFTVGAVFLGLDESSRSTLQSFLKLSPPSESQYAKHGR